MIRLHTRTLAGALRPVLAIALAITLVVSAIPQPTLADSHLESPFGDLPEFVDASTGPIEPVGRIQVIIRSVDVSNDRDGFWTGAGDIELTTAIWRCTGPNPPCSASDENDAEILAEDTKSFSADSGDFVALNRVIPSADDVISPNFASADGGIAVFDGQSYLVNISAFEEDFSGGDFMGGVQRIINKGNGWAVGVYTREPAGHVPDTSLPGRGLLCAGCGGIVVGDYLVTYEIRLMPLPDMHPTDLSVKSPGGPKPEVCATIANLGPEKAEAFGLIFTVDGDPTSTIGGDVTAGQSKLICAEVDPIAVGTHSLSVTVDPDRAIAEGDEQNNQRTESYVRRVIDDIVGPITGGVLDSRPGADPGQGPTMDPSPGQRANLQVSSIRVKGKDASGQNDCDPGKNDVTVVLRNQGNAAATNFAVRLIVDGKDNDAEEKTGINANVGQEVNVIFNDVELGPNTDSLAAIVDARKSVDESDENNNELKIAVSCKKE
jgi:hypothetical protein